MTFITPTAHSNFNPRSPCGERLSALAYELMEALFQSTLSLRRATKMSDDITFCDNQFQSTLSLRRATTTNLGKALGDAISIHALLAESDGSSLLLWGRAGGISIHALLAESDSASRKESEATKIFQSTLSLRRATAIGIVLVLFVVDFNPRSPCGERQRMP